MPPPRPSKAAAVVVAAACGLGLHGVGFWLLRDVGPDPDALRSAARHLRARHRPGDGIFILPTYATEIRERFGDLAPRAVRDPLLEEDLELLDRVWVVSSFGAEAEAHRRFVSAGHRPLERASFGGVTMDLFALEGPAAEVAWRALDAFRDVEVSHVHPGGRREACKTWVEGAKPGGPGGRWKCAHDGDWLYVGPEWHRMGERPRRCFWAHPPREGHLELRFPEVPPGAVLAGAGGHTLNASTRAQAPVFLDARMGDDGPSQRFVFELEDTWRPFRMRVPTSTQARTLVLSVSSPDNGANHFCFTVDLRRPRTRT